MIILGGQAAPDTTGVTATLDIVGSGQSLGSVPVQQEMKADSNVAAGLHYHVLQNDAGQQKARIVLPRAYFWNQLLLACTLLRSLCLLVLY